MQLNSCIGSHGLSNSLCELLCTSTLIVKPFVVMRDGSRWLDPVWQLVTAVLAVQQADQLAALCVLPLYKELEHRGANVAHHVL